MIRVERSYTLGDGHVGIDLDEGASSECAKCRKKEVKLLDERHLCMDVVVDHRPY